MQTSAIISEVIVFAGFYSVAIGAHSAHAAVMKRVKKKDVDAEVDHVHKHGIAAAFGTMGHAFAGAFHEYAVHFVVYSGHVIGGGH